MTRTDPGYFHTLYASNPDPWGFEWRWYERRKRALTLAALADERYSRAFEPGCSNGALTEQLAPRCDRLLASDQIPEVVERARTRVAGLPHVTVERRVLPEEFPDGPFDLIVLSEVAYYFDGPDWDALLAACGATLSIGGLLIAVHWRNQTDYPLTGDEAHRRLGEGPWEPEAHYEEQAFLLDTWRAR